MKFFSVVLLSALSVAAAKEWLSNANFYQIYPRSFMDSDGNGSGDLKGIASKVAYLKEIGMDGVWLSPIMKSPMRDHGYDISDYREINPEFGTVADVDNLIEVCKANGIYLILDFVPNHTSTDHLWFQKSEQSDPEYKDYYIWHPGKPNPAGERNLPPNNWLSVFRYSGWQWSDIRKEYYYHAFIPGQPDLNYRNPKVVDEMKEVLRFWLSRGISGFRIDAVPFLFEIEADADGNYPDEPQTGDANCDPDNYCYLKHIYTQDRPETFDMAYQWREVINEYSNPPRVLLTEAYTSLENIMKFYTDGNGRNGSHIPFNFELLSNINIQSTGKDIRTVVENYLNHVPDGFEANWVLGNHDQHRITSRLGPKKAELYNILLQTLPGNAVTYYGEEIVMPNVMIPWGLTQDPQACATNETIYHANSRDPARTPMQWDNTRNAGFTSGATTWLPVGSNYLTVNVKAQQEATTSHLKVFKKLTQLHKNNVFQTGTYESARNVPEDIYAYIRGTGNQAYIVVLNFGPTTRTLNLSTNFRGVLGNVRVELASLMSNLRENQVFPANSFALPGYGGVILSVVPPSPSTTTTTTRRSTTTSTTSPATSKPSSAATTAVSMILLSVSVVLAFFSH